MKKMISLASGLVFIIVCLVPLQVLADFNNLTQQPQESQASVKILSLNVMQNAFRRPGPQDFNG